MHDSLAMPRDQLIAGSHERCNDPHCRALFHHIDGKFQRVRGRDALYYCDEMCASRPYLTPRRYTGL